MHGKCPSAGGPKSASANAAAPSDSHRSSTEGGDALPDFSDDKAPSVDEDAEDPFSPLLSTIDDTDQGANATGRQSPGEGPGSTECLPQIPGYDVLDVITAPSGQGTVYRALQKGTKREVALKFLKADSFHSRRQRLRFEREVAVTASLSHPNIARVYETGIDRGVYFFAMEWIAGSDLNAYARAKSLKRDAILRVMLRVCRAVQYAHERGIIHRDLKPANILVTADGEPHLLDFGLAKMPDQGPEVTQPGEIAGTIRYMSPWQAEGRVGELSTRTDVYSLGVILYELLTGRHPHSMEGTNLAICYRIAHEDVRRPSMVVPSIGRELEAILLRALALDPARRYANAGDLADDIERFLTGEVVRARPQTLTYVLVKLLLKHRAVVAAITAFVLVAVAGVLFYIRAIRAEQQKTEHHRQIAVEQAHHARVQRTVTLRTLDRLVFEVQKRLSRSAAQIELRKSLIDLAMSELKNVLSPREYWGVPTDRYTAAAQVIVGDISASAGRPAEATKAYEKAIGALTELLAGEPENPWLLQDLCVAHSRMANLSLREGKGDAAETHLGHAQDFAARLEKQDPDATGTLANDFALATLMGEVRLDGNRPGEARAFFTQAMEAARSLAERSKAIEAQRNVALCLKHVGDADFAEGQYIRAEEAYRQALRIDMDLLRSDPNSLPQQRDRAVTQTRLAHVALGTNRAQEAHRLAGEARKTFELARLADPDAAEPLRDTAEAELLLGMASLTLGRSNEAVKHAMIGLGVLDGLEKMGRLAGQLRMLRLRNRLRDLLGKARKGTPARDDPTAGVEP